MKKNRQISLPFIFSLVLHGILALLLFLSPKFDPSQLHRAPLNQVELMDPEQLLKKFKNLTPDQVKNGQIVEQDEQAINDEIDKDAKYLSRHNQKVIQQTQAALHGKFKNSDQSSGVKARKPVLGKPEESSPEDKKDEQTKEAGERHEKLEEQKKLLTSNDGVGIKTKPTLKDLVPSFRPAPPPVEDANVAAGGGEGASASDDHLKDVQQGMQTLLSTREFVYYTYYNRIKDKLRQYWEPKIKEKMERILRQGRAIASTQERITKVVIVLDGHGTLLRVQIIGPSGVTDLDDAAAEAFRAAAPFPNPPKGIVESDGTIKIRWDFILEA